MKELQHFFKTYLKYSYTMRTMKEQKIKCNRIESSDKIITKYKTQA